MYTHRKAGRRIYHCCTHPGKQGGVYTPLYTPREAGRRIYTPYTPREARRRIYTPYTPREARRRYIPPYTYPGRLGGGIYHPIPTQGG